MKINIGISRTHMMTLLDEMRAEFEKPDVQSVGTAEVSFAGELNHPPYEHVEIVFSNDDMERDEITTQVFVEIES